MRRPGDVLGDESVQSVKDANCMLWRIVALLLICSAKGVFWILEQPERSLMESHPAIQLLFGCVRCYRVSIHMEDFGAKSKKPTWLYSSAWSAQFHVGIYIYIYTEHPLMFEDVSCAWFGL